MEKLRKFRRYKKDIIIVGVFVILLLALYPTYYFYNRFEELKKNTQNTASDAIVSEKDKVARLIELPTDEEPVLATVTDKNKLNDQQFFANSKNGDKVLIYEKARKAYLYRPSTDKLIEVSTLNITSDTSNRSSIPKKIQTDLTRVILRNGTHIDGLAATLESEINNAIPDIIVTTKENAVDDKYKKTLVIALNEKSRQKTAALAKYLNAQVSDLPAKENKPANAEILVIIGNDIGL